MIEILWWKSNAVYILHTYNTQETCNFSLNFTNLILAMSRMQTSFLLPFPPWPLFSVSWGEAEMKSRLACWPNKRPTGFNFLDISNFLLYNSRVNYYVLMKPFLMAVHFDLAAKIHLHFSPSFPFVFFPPLFLLSFFPSLFQSLLLCIFFFFPSAQTENLWGNMRTIRVPNYHSLHPGKSKNNNAPTPNIISFFWHQILSVHKKKTSNIQKWFGLFNDKVWGQINKGITWLYDTDFLL